MTKAGTGNRERGTGNKPPACRGMERRAGRGTGNGEQGNGEQGNGEPGTGNGEPGTGNGKAGTRNLWSAPKGRL